MTLSFVEPSARRGVALALRFVGANQDVVVEGEERAPGAVNYFVGNDPARWRSEIPRYFRVVYRELWPGIDLALGPNQELSSTSSVCDPARVLVTSESPCQAQMEQRWRRMVHC